MDLVVKLGSGELLIKKLNVLKKVEKKAFGEFKAACEVLTQSTMSDSYSLREPVGRGGGA